MGQDNTSLCCCKRNKNENEFKNESNELNSQINNDNGNESMNNQNLKAYVACKKNSVLTNRDLNDSYIEQNDNLMMNGKTLKKQTNFLLLRKDKNSSPNLLNSGDKNKLKFNKINKPHEFFSSRAFSTVPIKTTFQPNKFLGVLKIQKLYRGFIFRKNYFPQIKKELETLLFTLLKNKYNNYLTDNLKKQEKNLGIVHNENEYKTLLLIKKDIDKSSHNLFTNLYIFKYKNIDSFYVGEVDINNNLNGRGILTLSDGTKYNGNFVNNSFTGKGFLIDNEGEFKKGNFEDGLLEGKGIQKLLNGCSFEGNFVRGIKNGFGKEESDEFIYEGEYKNDKKNGKGKLFFKNLNDSYEGNFEDNDINGNGIYKWENGEIYKGNFLKGKMNGEGKYTWPDGGCYKGNYINNIKEGNGIFKWSNGKIYEGPFKNGNPNGNGILIVKNIIYEINFEDGEIKGKLKEIDKKTALKKMKKKYKNKNNNTETLSDFDQLKSFYLSESEDSIYEESTDERKREKKKFSEND